LRYPGLKQAAVLEKTTSTGVHERWYLLTSMGSDKLKPKALLATIRKHWQIENGLHHVKDTTFQEDAHHTLSPNQGHAMAILRNTIVSLLNKTTPPAKRKMSRPLQAIHF
jgi:predicted transposase YbfD/YdcC